MGLIEELLEERGSVHGDFAELSGVSQAIKAIAREKITDPVLLEALDLISTKIARIIAGDHTLHDHWDDIAGYATLASRQLKEDKND
jgi:hypothetical protein